jgi:hypothetical protein
VTPGPATPEQLAATRRTIDEWADEALASNPLLVAVDREPQLDRWYLRMRGEDKLTITVWLTLRQCTLHFETYFMPAPAENVAACYEYLLRANRSLFAWRFMVGAEDAVYLVGSLPVPAVDSLELDRIVGTAYAYSERFFRPAMSIGYASRFSA